jgi:hypothetical protein
MSVKIIKRLGWIVLATLLLGFIAPFWITGILWGTGKVNFEIANRMARQAWLNLLEKK